MPVYSYRCECDQEWDAYRHTTDERVMKCPNCGKDCENRIEAPYFKIDGDGVHDPGFK